MGRYDGDWDSEQLDHFFRIRDDRLEIIDRASGRTLCAHWPDVRTVAAWINGGLLRPVGLRSVLKPAARASGSFLAPFLGSALGVVSGWAFIIWAVRHGWMRP